MIYEIMIGKLGPIQRQLMVIFLPNLFPPIRLQTNHMDHLFYPLTTINKMRRSIPWRIKEYQEAKFDQTLKVFWTTLSNF